jgi:hypothetical protein
MVRPVGTFVRTDSSLLTPDEWSSASIDLSKATKLKDVEFRSSSWSVESIVVALQTITPEHRYLQQILVLATRHSAMTGASVRQAIGEEDLAQLLDLDRLLVQFWESHSVRLKVVCVTLEQGRDHIDHLLPEVSGRGIVDFVRYSDESR